MRTRQGTQNLHEEMRRKFDFDQHLRWKTAEKFERFSDLHFSPLVSRDSTNVWNSNQSSFFAGLNGGREADRIICNFRLFRKSFRYNTALKNSEESLDGPSVLSDRWQLINEWVKPGKLIARLKSLDFTEKHRFFDFSGNFPLKLHRNKTEIFSKQFKTKKG